MEEFEREIKELLITTLSLEDISADDIVTEEPLFETGLGLDSIDSLEIGIGLQQTYGVKIDSTVDDVKRHFASVRNLAAFVADRRAS